MKEVDIDTLREHYPSEYQLAFDRWVREQDDVIDMLLREDVPGYVREQLEGTGWHYSSEVNYRVAFSQGDGVAIASSVYIDEFDEATLDELRKDFPMCVALLERDYLHVTSRLSNHSACSLINWELDTMQEDEGDEDFDDHVYRLSDGIYDGLPESVAFQAAQAEGFDHFADDLGDRLKDAESRVYRMIVEEIEFQTSEEMFIERARDFDEKFEVEDEEVTA